MFSNRYIFIYSSILVFIVALVLAFAATTLQPYQQKNLDIEHMRGILKSAQIDAGSNVIEAYNKYVKKEIVINNKGEELSIYSNGKFIKGNERAFRINLKEQLDELHKKGVAKLPLFEIEKNNEKIYVIPLYGKGLWGPIWGTIAIKDDFSTVVGVQFGHKSETPGLGAEIATPEFQAQFVGKQLFNKKGEFVSIKLVKGGIKNNPKIPEIHGVDAISGGTITSNGTTEMLYNCLINYKPYFEKLKTNENK